MTDDDAERLKKLLEYATASDDQDVMAAIDGSLQAIAAAIDAVPEGEADPVNLQVAFNAIDQLGNANWGKKGTIEAFGMSFGPGNNKCNINRIRIAIVVVLVAIIFPCIYRRDYSAKVVSEDSILSGYRVYHSLLRNTYLEDNYGSPLIIYSHPRSVTSPEKGAYLFHRDSWIIVDPIRAIFPADIYLRVSHDPKLELGKNEIKLNIEPKKRITISSK